MGALQVNTLENRRLENFLERHKAYYAYTGEIEIDRFLREILQKANEFVPSGAGSIPAAACRASSTTRPTGRATGARQQRTRRRRRRAGYSRDF